jgi:hypothetical protein
MADRDGAPVHELPDPSHPHRPDVDREPPPAPCLGCGGQHGGVGAEIHCLRETVRALRRLSSAQLAATNREHARLLECLKEFQPK